MLKTGRKPNQQISDAEMILYQEQTAKQLDLPCLSEAELYHSSRSGFFSLLTGSKTGKQQRSYPLSQMATVLPLVNPKQDTWLSQGEFFKPNRRVVNLARLGLLFADLDYYRLPNLAGRDPEDVLWMLVEHCSYEGLPVPSLVIFSGQGLQVKWLLEGTIPRQALPRWNSCQRALVDALADFGADPQAKDASRVLRLVNTVNTKSGEVCRVVNVATGTDGEPLRYNFELLCESLLPAARWDIESARQEKEVRKERFTAVQGERKGLIKGFSGSRLAWDRLNDLRKLAELRGGVQEGERMLYLHWQLNLLLLSGATHSSQMYYEAAELARQIDPSWSYNAPELKTLYHKAQAYNAGEKVEFNGRQYPALYTPKNDTFISLFRINGDEQPHMKTLISKDEKAKREKVRQRKYNVEHRGIKQTRAEYEGEAKAKAQQARELKAQGLSLRKIATQLEVSLGAVQHYLK